MKSKASYILFPVVLVIWGVIAYRFVGLLKQDKVAIPVTKTEEINISHSAFVQDTFSIAANYRDPFLTQQVHQSVISKSPAKIIVSPKPVKQNLPWPLIVYHGLVKNNNSSKAYAMVSINKKLKDLAINDETEGIKIVNIQRDSLVVTFNNERKSILRGKKNEKSSK